MKPIRTRQDIERLGTIMGVWAHPDDEVMSMCGILCRAVQNGQQVVCVTATRGEAGVTDESRWPTAELGTIREQELKAAYGRMGITQHHFLGYADGGCDAVDDEQAVQRLLELIEKYQPDSVFTFGPDGLTGHPDHQAVSGWAGLASVRATKRPKLYHSVLSPTQREALRPIDEQFNFFFNIGEPVTCTDDQCAVRLELDDDLLACKMDCLRAMPSQYEAVLAEFGNDLRFAIGAESFIQASQGA